jgi:hypothetical protein
VTTTYPTCRRLNRYGDRCTAEVAYPDGESQLCSKHLAQAGRDIQAAIERLTTPTEGDDPA